jgi:hypothetical protein
MQKARPTCEELSSLGHASLRCEQDRDTLSAFEMLIQV